MGDSKEVTAERAVRRAQGRVRPYRHDWDNLGCPKCQSRDVKFDTGVRQAWWCRECARVRDRNRGRNYGGVVSDYRANRLVGQEPEHDRFMRFTQVLAEFPAEWLPSLASADRVPSPCTVWTGGTLVGGYGHFRRNDGTQCVAHGYVWDAVHGLVPEGYVRNHICRNPPCVNVEHLELLTDSENRALGYGQPISKGWDAQRKSHCKNCGASFVDGVGFEYSDGRFYRLCPEGCPR